MIDNEKSEILKAQITRDNHLMDEIEDSEGNCNVSPLAERRVTGDRRHTQRKPSDRRFMSQVEFDDLRRESGIDFLSVTQAHQWRRQRIIAQSVTNLLEDFRKGPEWRYHGDESL